MRLHKIAWSSGVRYIDLDHILALDPPCEGAYEYSFLIHMAFQDKPMRIFDDQYELSHILRHERLNKAFKELYEAWCGEKYEQDSATT